MGLLETNQVYTINNSSKLANSLVGSLPQHDCVKAADQDNLRRAPSYSGIYTTGISLLRASIHEAFLHHEETNIFCA